MPGVLALLAHPDDEFFCGGLLSALAARGAPVHLAFWTRGEGGLSPKRRFVSRFLPHGSHVRVREAHRSAQVIGASSVSFLKAIDPVPDPRLRAPIQAAAAFLKNLQPLLAKTKPDLILAHGSNGEYGHPAHIRLHRLVREAVADSREHAMFSFGAACEEQPPSRLVNRADPAQVIFDSQPWFTKKAEILRAHRTQINVFETLAGEQGKTLPALLELVRFEGYRCWSGDTLRDRAIDRLEAWLGPGALKRAAA